MSIDQKELQLKAAKRLLAIREARERMLPYMRLLMPDPNDPGDAEKSRYVTTPLAKILCEVIGKVERGELKRVCLSVGPQMGKSQIISRAAPAWLTGKNPALNTMLGSYNQDFANDFGAEVRDIIKSKANQQVFPDCKLKVTSVDHLVTTDDGQLNFIGVGGSGTGKPADLFVVDDPIRSDDDAQSQVYRDRIWKWFNSVVFTRGHDKTAIIVVHTRWHQDDLIGRLCDPDHPERNGKYAGIADNWKYINLPAVVKDPVLAHALGLTLEAPEDEFVQKQFGTEPMSSLWPGRKSLPLLAEAKQQDDRVFGALYMGEPTPEDGDYFKKEMLLEYGPGDLPKNLRFYAASDHAVSVKQMADKTVLGGVGVDDDDNIYVMPDLVWKRMETDETVEEIIRLMKQLDPQMWWMESELISKSFGPFLRKRMDDERVYTFLKPVTPSKDKMTRARAIQGRMQGKKVFFPRHATWWPDAKSQLLKFPFGANDDFVDFIAHIGMGLRSMLKAPREANDNVGPPSGSIEWILGRAAAQARMEKRAAANSGW